MITILYWSNFSSLTQGGQRSLSYILRDIDRSKYKPVLACREEGTLTSMAQELGIAVELFRLPAGIRPWYFIDILKFIFKLLKVIDKHKIKIIHSEELTVVFMAFFLKPVRQIITIWHVRVLWDMPFQKRIAVLISNAIVCVSRTVGESFRSTSNKINIICIGINPDEFKPESEKAKSPLFTDNDVLIGQVGTLVEHKKTHILLTSASAVLKKHPAAKFIIIGQGEKDYTQYLKNLAKELHIDKNIIFWGEEKNIKPLLNRLNIVCLLSKNEGLSRTLLESMCFEKTIIASDIPENCELIVNEKTGLTAELNSPEDTARQINRLLDDKAFAAGLGKAAREYIINNFSLKKTITLIEALYEKII